MSLTFFTEPFYSLGDFDRLFDEAFNARTSGASSSAVAHRGEGKQQASRPMRPRQAITSPAQPDEPPADTEQPASQIPCTQRTHQEVGEVQYVPSISPPLPTGALGTVVCRAYTGYIDIEARHLFFYFFESRRDPDTDGIVLWTNGGPGGSSALGLFMELGPCRVTSPNSTERFDYAWNDHTNVFFIDQPVSVGLSYAEHGEHVGRYLPVFAAAVYDQNAELIEAGLTPVNLKSVMIGNGATNFIEVVKSYYDVQCKEYGFPLIASISFRESCIDITDPINCAAAWDFCWSSLAWQWERIDYYDWRHPCKGQGFESCYPEAKWIVDYLNTPNTQAILGTDPQHSNYNMQSDEIFARFSPQDFLSYRGEDYLAALLERGIRTLIYVGDTDWIANWVGNERMTLKLEWTQREAFASQPLRGWFVDGEVAGKTRRVGPLAYATIRDAGHLAPYDQPRRSLELVDRWLAGEEL
ncbi:alpha/beta-hydrolase [Lentinus tigrinus ALCF2SS1-7]|uniref:alpha/beta-hydrolase n=1 Tax=Lentinus tigrinus ALCF2SS1-7 TaxID=1328758 RepID=UPI001165CC49|nr:alpha/beta-hydrolase [Lentinus tigrinus ALCF2SS1-7]